MFHNEMDYEIKIKEFMIQKSKIGISMVFDALPSPLLDPSWVQRSHTVELFGTWSTLPTSITKRGRGVC
jgi:hypothetical protein